MDWPTTFQELEMLGIEVDPAYKEQVLTTVTQQAELKKEKKRQKSAEAFGQWGVDYDDHFAVIIGFTSGGAPYGLTW